MRNCSCHFTQCVKWHEHFLTMTTQWFTLEAPHSNIECETSARINYCTNIHPWDVIIHPSLFQRIWQLHWIKLQSSTIWYTVSLRTVPYDQYVWNQPFFPFPCVQIHITLALVWLAGFVSVRDGIPQGSILHLLLMNTTDVVLGALSKYQSLNWIDILFKIDTF